MPVMWLEAYAVMLVRLQREESMRLVSAVSYAFGSMDKEMSSEYARLLTPDRKPTFATPAAAAAALGIPIAQTKGKSL